MKLSEIIQKVNLQNLEDSAYYEIAEREFDIYGIPWIENCSLKFCFLKARIDTDSWVGTKLYFLDDKFVAISEQGGRKSNECFKWASKEAFKDVHDYFISLKEAPYHLVEFISEDIDIPDFFKLKYSNEIIPFKHKCYYLGQEVKISRDTQWCSSNVNVTTPEGDCYSVLVPDLDFSTLYSQML